MNKFQRSWALLKSSLAVIGQNKQLLVFPVVIFICTVTIVAFFLVAPALRPTGYSYLSLEHWKHVGSALVQEAPNANGQGTQLTLSRGAVAYSVFLYFVAMFVATFCNVAFYHEILAALSSQPVSIGRGLRFALSKLGSILMWTLFAGIVGVIIRMIEEKLEFVGRMIGRLIGLAWSIASVFVIPIIVCEEGNPNPFRVLQNSATLLKRTWGEALIGYAGLSIANLVIFIGSICWLGAALAGSIVLSSPWIIISAAVAWLVAICLWSYLVGVGSQVYKGALYMYASQGIVPTPYTQEMLDMAWKYRND